MQDETSLLEKENDSRIDKVPRVMNFTFISDDMLEYI